MKVTVRAVRQVLLRSAASDPVSVIAAPNGASGKAYDGVLESVSQVVSPMTDSTITWSPTSAAVATTPMCTVVSSPVRS